MFLAAILALKVVPVTDDVVLPVMVAVVAELMVKVAVLRTFMPSLSDVNSKVVDPACDGV